MTKFQATFLDQVKTQAQALVPILKGFQQELGKDRVNEIVKEAMAPIYRKFGADWWANTPGGATEKINAAIEMFALGDQPAIEVKELRRTDTQYDFDITRCRYAEFYKELGEPELGFLLVCGVDDPMTEGYGPPKVGLKRSRTIMQGASQCEFRYRVKG